MGYYKDLADKWYKESHKINRSNPNEVRKAIAEGERLTRLAKEEAKAEDNARLKALSKAVGLSAHTRQQKAKDIKRLTHIEYS